MKITVQVDTTLQKCQSLKYNLFKLLKFYSFLQGDTLGHFNCEIGTGRSKRIFNLHSITGLLQKLEGLHQSA